MIADNKDANTCPRGADIIAVSVGELSVPWRDAIPLMAFPAPDFPCSGSDDHNLLQRVAALESAYLQSSSLENAEQRMRLCATMLDSFKPSSHYTHNKELTDLDNNQTCTIGSRYPSRVY